MGSGINANKHTTDHSKDTTDTSGDQRAQSSHGLCCGFYLNLLDLGLDLRWQVY